MDAIDKIMRSVAQHQREQKKGNQNIPNMYGRHIPNQMGKDIPNQGESRSTIEQVRQDRQSTAKSLKEAGAE